MPANAVIVHGGAPTAVINASLYGALTEAAAHREIGHFYAALGGTGGLMDERFFDLLTASPERTALLPDTPASAIGTSRKALEEEDYARIAEVIKKHDIRYVFFTGGNGTMDACGKTLRACRALGCDARVVGIPKTIDNDINVTDHAPGFGSAARYLAATVSEVSQDVRALPIHVSVIEAMGRNAGWLTASSALARSGDGDGPDLIYLPERPFDEDRFLSDIEEKRKEKSGIVVVASEGLKKADGTPIVPPIFQVGRAVYYGDVSAHLANLIIRRLKIKARSEKPGICGRASIAFQSVTDREEAILAGREAVLAALRGETGVMIGFEREPGQTYSVRTVSIPVDQVMLGERMLPDKYISENGHDVTDDFIDWCRPLIGGPLPRFVTFNDQ